MKVKPTLFVFVALLAAVLLTSCGATSASWHGVTANEELAYISAGSHIYAVRVSDGVEAWRYPEKASGKIMFYTQPTLTEEGLLLVGSAGTEHSLFYLDAKTGAYRNEFDGAEARWVAAPLVLGEHVYAPGGDGILYMLDMQGRKVGAFEAGGPLWSQPVSDGVYIYLGALNHHVYALDPKNLDVVWESDLGGAIAGSPALSPTGVLYIGTFASQVSALEAASGKVLWQTPTEGAVWGGPVTDGDYVYAADLSGRFYAFEAASGKRAWTPPQPDGPILGAPLVRADFLVVTTETGAVVGIDRDGKTKKLSTFEGKLYSPAVDAGDLILVAPLETEFLLTALDATGAQTWTFTPEKK